MSREAWHKILTVLKQRSTMVGLVGLVGGIVAAFGHVMTPEQSASITSALLAIVSVVAIATQPKPAGGKYRQEDYAPGDTYSDDSGQTKRFDGKKWS